MSDDQSSGWEDVALRDLYLRDAVRTGKSLPLCRHPVGLRSHSELCMRAVVGLSCMLVFMRVSVSTNLIDASISAPSWPLVELRGVGQKNSLRVHEIAAH